MLDFLKKWKKHFTFVALVSCFINILQLTFPFYMFTIYRNIIISYSSYSLSNITWAATFATITLGILYYCRSRLMATAGKELSVQMRQAVYAVMIRNASITNSSNNQIGITDIQTLNNYFSSPSSYALFDIPWSPFYLILIFLFSPALGTIAGIGAGIMVALSYLQQVLVNKSLAKANKLNVRNQKFVESFLRNSEVINGMGMIGAVSDRFISQNKPVMYNQIKSSNYAATIQAIIKPMQNMIQVGIYCAGAYFVMVDGFNVGLMVAASIIMGRAVAPLMQFMGAWQMTNQAHAAYLRLLQFEQQSPPPNSTLPLPPPQGYLEVDEANFQIGGKFLLTNINFSLSPGQFLGIIGHNGAGKSTLCRLLLGIWPAFGGTVRLDGNNIFSWNKEEIGPYIGYVPQEIELFPGTVAENIARLGDVDQDQLDRVVKLCGIEQLISRLPEGIDTQLDADSQVRLSGGQKQRIGLARALYGAPRLLVLDEPTSNLDEQGEQQLLKTLALLKQNNACTCIIVTHKMSMLQAMDKILLLQQGKVEIFGPKENVLAQLRVPTEHRGVA